MTFLFQMLISGINLGMIYALITIGLVMVFKCSGVFNISHGGIILLGGYLGWSLLTQLNLPLWLSFLIAILIAVILGISIQHIALRPIIGRPVLIVVMMTIALLVFIEGLVVLIWKGDYVSYPQIFTVQSIVFKGISISMESVIGTCLSIIVLGLFLLFFQYSKYGLSMRAAAEDEQVVQSAGINVTVVYRLAWIISSIVAVIGGMLLGSISGVMLPMADIGLKALVIAMFGGLESIAGCIVAGLIIGIAENLACGYLDPLLPAGGGLANVFPFLVIMILLMLKPSGIFGLARIERI